METYLLSNTALSVSGMFFCSSRGKNLTEWKLYFYFQQPTFLVIHKVLFYLETNRRYDATRTINPFTPLVRLLTCGQVGQHQEVSTWTRSSTTRSNKALCFLRNPNESHTAWLNTVIICLALISVPTTSKWHEKGYTWALPNPISLKAFLKTSNLGKWVNVNNHITWRSCHRLQICLSLHHKGNKQMQHDWTWLKI